MDPRVILCLVGAGRNRMNQTLRMVLGHARFLILRQHLVHIFVIMSPVSSSHESHFYL